MAPLLELERIEKAFAGIRAVDGLSLAVPDGAVVGLCGPNGSGKTTAFNCITGLYRPDRGRVLFEGRDITGANPYRVAHFGIGRTFQLVRIFPEMSVIENLVVVARQRNGRDVFQRVTEVLEWVGLTKMAEEEAATLSFGQKKLLELARVLLLDPKLLLLDEPAAGVNPALLQKLLRILHEFHRRGRAVLIVEHNMRVITDLCQFVVVVDHGQKIAEGTPEEVRRNPEVLRAYLGT
ncbi:MAG: ABC transporter ATP-binding protein [Candidatus Rokubacteria bacterium]|nr:ABC transporter ATP-binding protein [Candidatus Rokubacteria bacterium]